MESKWSKTSTKLLSDPDNLSLWEQLIKDAEYNNKLGINKSSSVEAVDLLHVTYNKFLDKYPLLFGYWIRYAEWEFKLGNTLKAELIYEKSLQHLSYSIEIWVSYLNFKINTINNNILEVLSLFEKARRHIGNHFHGYEFYVLYLQFLQDYETADPPKFKSRYYVLYRIIIEIPLYHYEHFFKSFMDIITELALLEKEKFRAILPYLIPTKDLNRYSKLEPKSVAVSLKKIFVDIFITTQYKVYELYAFEKEFTRQYYDVKLLLIQQQDKWDLYIDFLKLKYPQEIVMLNIERCLIVTSSYPRFWIKYANYFISSRQFLQAIEVLSRGYSFNNHYKLLIKLIDVHITLEQYTKAKDLLVAYITNNVSIPIPIYEKLIAVERLTNDDETYLISLFKEIILETNNDWFFQYILLFGSISKEAKLGLCNELTDFKDSENYKDALRKLSLKGREEKEIDFSAFYDEEMALYK